MLALAGIGVAFITQANAVTFNFQENGSNTDLGPTSTFTESGISLTASGFLTAGGATNLYAKSQGIGETGLGTVLDTTDHEILTTDFVQLTLPTVPPSNFDLVILASVQAGESAKIYFTTTAGTLTGATLLGTLTADGSFNVNLPANTVGFIDVTAGSGNVLLESATFTPAVPDGGSTVALLGVALAGLEGLRRKMRARRA